MAMEVEPPPLRRPWSDEEQARPAAQVKREKATTTPPSLEAVLKAAQYDTAAAQMLGELAAIDGRSEAVDSVAAVCMAHCTAALNYGMIDHQLWTMFKEVGGVMVMDPKCRILINEAVNADEELNRFVHSDLPFEKEDWQMLKEEDASFKPSSFADLLFEEADIKDEATEMVVSAGVGLSQLDAVKIHGANRQQYVPQVTGTLGGAQAAVAALSSVAKALESKRLDQTAVDAIVMALNWKAAALPIPNIYKVPLVEIITFMLRIRVRALQYSARHSLAKRIGWGILDEINANRVSYLLKMAKMTALIACHYQMLPLAFTGANRMAKYGSGAFAPAGGVVDRYLVRPARSFSTWIFGAVAPILRHAGFPETEAWLKSGDFTEWHYFPATIDELNGRPEGSAWLNAHPHARNVLSALAVEEHRVNTMNDVRTPGFGEGTLFTGFNRTSPMSPQQLVKRTTKQLFYRWSVSPAVKSTEWTFEDHVLKNEQFTSQWIARHEGYYNHIQEWVQHVHDNRESLAWWDDNVNTFTGPITTMAFLVLEMGLRAGESTLAEVDSFYYQLHGKFIVDDQANGTSWNQGDRQRSEPYQLIFGEIDYSQEEASGGVIRLLLQEAKSHEGNGKRLAKILSDMKYLESASKEINKDSDIDQELQDRVDRVFANIKKRDSTWTVMRPSWWAISRQEHGFAAAYPNDGGSVVAEVFAAHSKMKALRLAQA